MKKQSMTQAEALRRVVPERFWSLVDKSSDCWVWKGAVNKHRRGYGVFNGARTPVFAHRVAWYLAFGELPAGLVVCHRCDNPPCVNPAHLFLGTVQDNLRDMRTKCRHARGERNGSSKLTRRDVAAIREALASGQTQQTVAERYGVLQSTVSDIATGVTWAQGKAARS